MKKLLSVLALAGSVAGIASTTTACGQEPTQSQAEKGIRAYFGLESETGCSAFRDNDDALECVANNQMVKSMATEEELAKVTITLSDWKKTKDQETTVEWEFTLKLEGWTGVLEDANTSGKAAVRMIKDSGYDWRIDAFTTA